jgi:uncharacterized damage-inducible protein DinB
MIRICVFSEIRIWRPSSCQLSFATSGSPKLDLAAKTRNWGQSMPASLVTTYRAMAYNNAWANHRLLEACARLTLEEFEAPRIGFFPTLKATLNHILVIDWFYVDALEGGRLGPEASANPEPCATVADLQRQQAAVDKRLIVVCEAVAETALSGDVRINRDTRIQIERRDRLLLHVFQHQIHHRGQAHAMLSGTSVKPPQLDEFFSIGEAPLRAAEFAALGWTEAMVWGSEDGAPT